jgi:hypothetical protein
MALIDGPGPQRPSFWNEHCPDRPGADLTHVQNGGPFEPCAECGMTPGEAPDPVVARRLAELGSLPAIAFSDPADHDYDPTITGLCRRPNCRRPQTAHMARIAQPPYMEARHATGALGGPENGPGRGALTSGWKSWARIALTPIDSEYR